MKVFMVLIMIAYLIQVIIYWDCRVNQVNRIIIVVLYIFVGLVQIVSTVIFLKESRQTFKICFSAARTEIRDILIAFILSYAYTSFFYIVIICKANEVVLH